MAPFFHVVVVAEVQCGLPPENTDSNQAVRVSESSQSEIQSFPSIDCENFMILGANPCDLV
jgi:hypothetical protein